MPNFAGLLFWVWIIPGVNFSSVVASLQFSWFSSLHMFNQEHIAKHISVHLYKLLISTRAGEQNIVFLICSEIAADWYLSSSLYAIGESKDCSCDQFRRSTFITPRSSNSNLISWTKRLNWVPYSHFFWTNGKLKPVELNSLEHFDHNGIFSFSNSKIVHYIPHFRKQQNRQGRPVRRSADRQHEALD